MKRIRRHKEVVSDEFMYKVYSLGVDGGADKAENPFPKGSVLKGRR
jgi:hypothetical protein